MILRSKKMREIYKSKMQGSVDRRRSIPDDILLEMEIPIPAENVMNEILQQQRELVSAKQRVKDLNRDLHERIESLLE